MMHEHTEACRNTYPDCEAEPPTTEELLGESTEQWAERLSKDTVRRWAKMPADWREWASDDPANHPPGCTCLDDGYCVLAYDAHQWRLRVTEEGE